MLALSGVASAADRVAVRRGHEPRRILGSPPYLSTDDQRGDRVVRDGYASTPLAEPAHYETASLAGPFPSCYTIFRYLYLVHPKDRGGAPPTCS